MARYGGEAFVVLLPDSDAAIAAVVGERLRVAIAGCEVVSNGEVVPLSCSVGGATMQPIHHLDSQFLLEQADAGLYQAKALGRNRYIAAKMQSTFDLRAQPQMKPHASTR